jgi:hypothetical protein
MSATCYRVEFVGKGEIIIDDALVIPEEFAGWGIKTREDLAAHLLRAHANGARKWTDVEPVLMPDESKLITYISTAIEIEGDVK